jgi:hypothetical protein
VLPLTGSLGAAAAVEVWAYKGVPSFEIDVDRAINVPASVGQQTHSNNLKTLQIADGAYVKLTPLTNHQVVGVNHS